MYAGLKKHNRKCCVVSTAIKTKAIFSTLDRNQLAKTLFPVGELEKPEVREIAAKLELTTALKKDSTGICFIGERKFKDFLAKYLPAQPGQIETIEGQIIGEHQGLMYYTLGQRKGIGIGGLKNNQEMPWYVVKKDLKRNVLIVGQGRENELLMSDGMWVQQLHWVDRQAITKATAMTVKTRYRQQDVECTVTPHGDDQIKVVFSQPVSAVTPGQSAVFYQDEVCLGGGIIETTFKNEELNAKNARGDDGILRICQSVKLIQEIARDGKTDQALLKHALQTILKTDPENTLDVYQSPKQLMKGYEVLIAQLSTKQHQDTELMRYILGILMLEQSLIKKNHVLSELSSRIKDIHRQLKHFDLCDPQIVANLASIYSEVISPLGTKVMISGRQNLIQIQSNQHKIRALLLATMRSAVLWRQLGGKHRHLIFKKKEMIEHAKQQLSLLN